MSTATEALDAYDAGLCVIRAHIDGSKAPVGEWAPFQQERPTREQVVAWFEDGYPGMGIVCGATSGGLEMFELEGRAVRDGVLEQFKAKVREAGLREEWERIFTGYSERTPSGGIHVLWRCEEVEPNQPLARRLTPEGKIEVLIETRGEGGFTITAPSNGKTHPSGGAWERLCGEWGSITTISLEVRRRILAIAASLDQLPEPEPYAPKATTAAIGDRPGDEFEEGHDCHDVLAAAGFKVHSVTRHGPNAGTHYTRPGKPVREGSSATVYDQSRHDGQSRCTLYSSAIDVPVEFLGARSLTAWQLHVAFKFSGDFAEAARAWRRDHPRKVDGLVLKAPTGVDPSTGGVAPGTLPSDFWDARPALAHIRQAAHARQRSADAVLHVVLARLAAFTPHTTLLPAIVGAPAPLSYFAVVVAPTGVGKSSATSIGTEILPGPEWVADQLPIGSGEGLAEVLFDVVEEEGEDGKRRQVKRQVRHGAFVYADEGQVLTEIGNRKGGTLLPTLRTIWTGGTIGQANASNERKRIVPAGSYTYGVTLGLQPSKAGALLADADAGTPGRFGWASATDPAIPDTPPTWPGVLDWKQPPVILGEGLLMDVADAIADELRSVDLARARGRTIVHALEAHGGLYQLKVAGLLAVLDGRHDVDVEDWELAKTVRVASDAVRQSVQASVAAEVERQEGVTVARHVNREAAVDGARERREKVLKYALAIAEKVRANPGELSPSDLRKSKCSVSWRSLFADALVRAGEDGLIEERTEPGQGGDKVRLWPVDET